MLYTCIYHMFGLYISSSPRRDLEGRLKSQGPLPFAVLEPYLKLLAKFDETEAMGLLEELETAVKGVEKAVRYTSST